MRRYSLTLLFLFGLFSLTGLGTGFAFDLKCSDPSDSLIIVTAEKPSPAAQLSALELQNYLGKMTGKTIAIVPDSEQVRGKFISVGDTKLSRAAGYDPAQLKRFEYVLDIRNDQIYLLGQDDSETKDGTEYDYNKVNGLEGEKKIVFPGLYERKETTRAAYDLLERLGVRFYGPRFDNVLWDVKENLTLPNGVTKREPFLKYTNGFVWTTPLNTFPYGYKSEHDATQDVRLFNLRLRAGGIPWYINHTYGHLKYKERFPQSEPKERSPFFERVAPEFYPPTGSKSHQFCYTSEALADQVAKDAADFFDGKRFQDEKVWALIPGTNYFSVVPEDCGNFCTCEKCQALLKAGEGQFIEGKFNDGRSSLYVFNFANMVAKRLKKTHPDKYVAVLAYENYYWMPKDFEFESNIAVVPCMQVCSFWDQNIKMDDMKWYGVYARLVKRGKLGPLYVWNYYHHPEEIGLVSGFNVFPQFSSHMIDTTIKKYASDGVLQGIFHCGSTSQPDMYLTLKLYDDPQLDMDRELNEYFTRYFGKAAGPMREFYDLIEDWTTNPDQRINIRYVDYQRTLYEFIATPDRLLQLQDLISRAKMLEPTGIIRDRIDAWDRAYMQYIWLGRAQYQKKQEERTNMMK
ncbi:MAG: DUF4838 domain-containing protein [Thermoguttaceae bacterium]